jgi:hypothetical protein
MEKAITITPAASAMGIVNSIDHGRATVVDEEGLDRVKSISQLIVEQHSRRDAAVFASNVRSLPAAATQSLILHVGTYASGEPILNLSVGDRSLVSA